MEVLNTGLIWLGITTSLVFIFLVFGKFFIKDQKIRSIFTFVTTNVNTGNLGIPLGIALFGAESIIYTTLINLINVFWNFIFGVYFVSRGQYSIKESIKNIFKLPILWAAIAGLMVNYYQVIMPAKISENLEIGAHASIALQLFLLGIFIATVQIKKIYWRMSIWTVLVKFAIMPLLIIFLGIINLDEFFALTSLTHNILILQLMVPLAVNNVNLASLYDCRPRVVAELVLFTSILFLLFSPLLFLFFRF